MLSLGHELSHAWRTEHGLDPEKVEPGPPSIYADERLKNMSDYNKKAGEFMIKIELGASHIENMIRS